MSTPSSGPRSPLPHSPLRHPGEATREPAWTEFVLRTAFAFGFVSALWFWALAAWVFRALGLVPSPWWPTLLALGSAAVVAVLYRRDAGPVLRALRGARGEREVGEHLAALAARGYRAFHNLEFPRRNGQGTFDVDHVLVGPAGVFAIETKYAGKPPRGRAEITYDGSRVLVNGRAPERDPVAQARASADTVAGLLRERAGLETGPYLTGRETGPTLTGRETGPTLAVRPVVLYPGWYVRSRSGAVVWVLTLAFHPRDSALWALSAFARIITASRDDSVDSQADPFRVEPPLTPFPGVSVAATSTAGY